MARDKEESAFLGKGSSSEEQNNQYRCPCGELFPFRNFSSIDALTNPELACQATETDPERALNTLFCPDCGHASQAQLPFTYHNGTERLFVLVLPESYRNRELLERARLCQELSTDKASIPGYVLEFPVVYGPKGLAAHLSARAKRHEAADKADARARDLKISGEKVASREEEMLAREAAISSREAAVLDETESLDRRSSELTERELNLRDRKGALDRRSSELEVKTEQLQKAQLALRIETDGEGRDTLPEILKENSTVALDVADILTSAASDNPEHIFQASNSATGSSSVGKRPEAPLAEQDSPFNAREELFSAPNASRQAATRDDKTRVSAPNPTLVSAASGPGKSKVIVASDTDSELVRWKKLDTISSKRIIEGKVELRARIDASAIGELGAQDLRALLQLHRMDSYPLVTLTLATANTLSGQPGTPFSFHFDVADPDDRKILDMMSEDFSFSLSVYDSEYEELRVRTVAAPLGSNVRYVVALAKGTLEAIDSGNRSFGKAIGDFGDSQYDRLGRKHELARLFRDSVLDRLKKTADLQAALRLCETFSEPAHEEYLIATRSYPLDRWTRRRLRVIGKSLKAGLWLDNSLAQIDVSEELAGSRKDLVSQSQKNFSRYAAMGDCEMDVAEISKNWELLDREAERLGISVPGAPKAMIDNQVIESSTIPKDRKGEDAVLLAALDALDDNHEVKEESASSDLSTLVALCADTPPGGADAIFRLLTELDQEEAPAGFAAAIGLGKSAVGPLRELIDCPTVHLKQGAALALCELRDAQGIDSVCELLVSSEGLIWHELAVGLGHVGDTAVMPIVARVAQGDKQTATRGGWALAHIAALGGTKPVETLSNSRNSNVARVATAALELGKKIRRGDWATIKRGDPERAFTTRFYQSLQFEKRDKSELSGPMMLDESDLMEAVE